MNYYQDITLLPDAEANLGFLWHKVYQQLHLALVENKVTEEHSAIGLSIPEYDKKKGKGDFPLGQKIRLFAKQETELASLDLSRWLKRFLDYAHVTSVKAVPNNVTEFACFERKHIKGETRIQKDILKKAQHQSAKFDLPLEACLKEAKSKAVESPSQLPYINVKSLSSQEGTAGTKNSFPLFISMRRFEQAQQGQFSCYGLSRNDKQGISTVPWF